MWLHWRLHPRQEGEAMAPCRPGRNLDNRRERGEALAPFGQLRITVSQRQNRDAEMQEREPQRDSEGRVQMTNRDGQHDSGETLGEIAAQGIRNAA
jgi:hypothetical protein